MYELRLSHPQVVFIINYDDFGLSLTRDQALGALLLNRRISSLSAVVTSPHIQQSIPILNEFAKEHPDIYQCISIGMHFNLTQGPAIVENYHTTTNGQYKGKEEIYALAESKQLPPDWIIQQFQSQVRIFEKLFHRRPTHLDGHNHIHVIPDVARAIAPILQQNGIYRVRIPIENLRNLSSPRYKFNVRVVQNAKQSFKIYQAHGVITTNEFMGLQLLENFRVEDIAKRIQEIRQKQRDSQKQSSQSIELMCHAGYSDIKSMCSFSKSMDRQKQMQILLSPSFESLIAHTPLSSFSSLQAGGGQPAILLISKLQNGCGNLTTCQRMAKIFKQMGYRTYIRPVQQQSTLDHTDLQTFLVKFRITLIIGVNLTRTAKLIHMVTRGQGQGQGQHKISYGCPYLLVVAGTDANNFFHKPQAKVELKQPIAHSLGLIALSQAMKIQTEKFLSQINVRKDIITIPQSSDLSIIPKRELPQQIQTIIKSKPYILLPTSFRKVKSVHYLLSSFNKLISSHNLNVIICGPILDQKYYEDCAGKIQKVLYIGTLPREQYYNLLNNAKMVINCSESEGMSCAILEAFEIGIPVLARNNPGNAQLIKHRSNGLLFNTVEQFQTLAVELIQDTTLRQTIIKQASYVFKSKYCYQREYELYSQVIQQKLLKKLQVIELEHNSKLRIFSPPGVHPCSAANMKLFQGLGLGLGEDTCSRNVLDLGCGNGVFGMMYLASNLNSTQNSTMVFSDIDLSALNTTYYNLIQSNMVGRGWDITLKKSNMFNQLTGNSFDRVLANLPQTPFRHPQSRVDRNGGSDGLKYHTQLLEYYEKYLPPNCKLTLLYSSMAWPAKFNEYLAKLNLSISYSSEPQIHHISAQNYEAMEEGLSEYIRMHASQGRAQIQIIGSQFRVPARIIIIQKQGLNIDKVKQSQITQSK